MISSRKKQIFSAGLILLFFFTLINYSRTLKLQKKIRDRNQLKASDFDDIFGDIRIERPSSLDMATIGEPFKIKWNYKGSIELVCIALFRNHYFIDTISITTINDGEYIWFVDNYTESDDYSIGIWDYNDFGNNDFSDFFIISSSPLDKSENGTLTIVMGIIIAFSLFFIYFLIKKKRKG